jgi:hypothetical protein
MIRYCKLKLVIEPFRLPTETGDTLDDVLDPFDVAVEGEEEQVG